MAERKTWADYPYEFKPEKTLTTKELTELLYYLFGMKAFPEEFVKNLPNNLQKHFKMREDVYSKPDFIKKDIK